MANIASYLEQINNARYGKDVRSSIHDSIKAMNDQIETDVMAEITTAQSTALGAISSAQTTATNAIATDKGTALSAISSAKSDATGQIATDKKDATDQIATDKAAAITDIEAKRVSSLASIPDDYTALGNSVNQLKEDLAELGNGVVDISEYIINGKVTIYPLMIDNEAVKMTDGTFFANTAYKRTAYVLIPYACSSMYVKFSTTSNYNGLAFYDKNKNYISSASLNANAGKNISVPDNAYYFSCCDNTNNSSNYYIEFEYDNSTESVNRRIDGGITIYPLTIAGSYVSVSDGVVGSGASYNRSDFIKIPKYTKQIGTDCVATSSYNGIAFYNANKEFIEGSGVLINHVDGCMSMEVPNDAKYIRVCDNSGNTNKTMKFGFNELYGKTLYSDGDSIAQGIGTAPDGSDGISYSNLFAEKYNMYCNNQAIGGGTISSGTTKPDGSNRHWVCQSIIDNLTHKYDYVIIEGGFNDEGNGVEIGALSSNADVPISANPSTRTFTGALESIFKRIMTQYPTTKIYFLCVHHIYKYYTKARVTDKNYAEYLEQARNVCDRYGIEVIDVYKESGFNTYFIEHAHYTLEDDRTHPTIDGYKQFYLPIMEKHFPCNR